MPKSHKAILSWAKIQIVMNTAASTSNTAKPTRRPSRSIIQPPAQKPVVANSAHQI
jgi:hypothetical protein